MSVRRPDLRKDHGPTPKCKIIARYGIGVDTIDLEAATEAGIIVTNNPTYCLEEVAEHTMAMLLGSARKIAHVAWYSEQAMAGLQRGAPNEVRHVLGGEWPVNVVNPSVKGKNHAGL